MVFIADLFIISKTWKQPRCPSLDEWINKLRYIQRIEYYSVLKKKKMRYKSMKRHEGSLNSYYQVKEIHHKKITYCVIPT